VVCSVIIFHTNLPDESMEALGWEMTNGGVWYWAGKAEAEVTLGDIGNQGGENIPGLK